jgi:hypothetical protein
VRVGILYQEDPVVFGPFLRRTILERPGDVAVLIQAGHRGAGGHPRTIAARMAYAATLWLIWETPAFVRACARRLAARFADRSVAALGRELGIPVLTCSDPNDAAFRARLARHELDVVFNQSEHLLRRPLLEVPRLGFISRHGSLLPAFRGRMASFWAHATPGAAAGVTVHRVDEGLDTGPILARDAVPVDPRWDYARVLDALFESSPELVWRGIDRLADPAFVPEPNLHDGTRAYRVPTLSDALAYRLRLARLRCGGPAER